MQAYRSHRHRVRPRRTARGGAGGEAQEIRARGREGPARGRRLRAHRNDPLEDAARDGAQPFGLARARLLWARPSRTSRRSRRRICGAALAITLDHEVEVLEHQFARNNVQLGRGEARFLDPLHIEVATRDRTAAVHRRHASSSPSAPSPTGRAHIPFDGEAILDPDEILELKRLPRSLSVIGAGVIGIEYATIFSALDVKVTVIEPARPPAALHRPANWWTSSSTTCATAACRCACRAR